MNLSWISYAESDLNKLNYCIKERDQAEKTLDICDYALQSCEQVKVQMTDLMSKQEKIVETQITLIESKNKELSDLKNNTFWDKVLFGGIGLVIGIVLHIPLALFIK